MRSWARLKDLVFLNVASTMETSRSTDREPSLNDVDCEKATEYGTGDLSA